MGLSGTGLERRLLWQGGDVMTGKKVVLAIILLVIGIVVGVIIGSRFIKGDDKEEAVRESVAEEDDSHSHNSSSDGFSLFSGRQSSEEADVKEDDEAAEVLDTESDEKPADAAEDINTDSNTVIADEVIPQQPAFYAEGYDFKRFKDWQGDYEGGWLNIVLTVELYPKEDGYECGRIIENFKGNYIPGTLMYMGDNMFKFQTSETFDGTYILRFDVSESGYVILVYDWNDNYDCVFTMNGGFASVYDHEDNLGYGDPGVLYCTVTAPDGYVNFRTGPGTTYDIIMPLSNGVRLMVTGVDSTNNNWLSVVYYDSLGNQYMGWVNRTQVTMD